MLKGKIPQSWKNAKVTPIFKAGDPTDVSNYRTISVIPVIMKVFERIVHNQQSTYLNDNKLLYEYQSGFRSKFSLRRHSSMLQNISSMGSTQGN